MLNLAFSNEKILTTVILLIRQFHKALLTLKVVKNLG